MALLVKFCERGDTKCTPNCPRWTPEMDCFPCDKVRLNCLHCGAVQSITVLLNTTLVKTYCCSACGHEYVDHKDGTHTVLN